VEVPDLPGCVSEGDSLAEAIIMGTDAASGWVLTELEDGKPAPAPAAFFCPVFCQELLKIKPVCTKLR
jgi:predicted RNase H-like HicB family nuclease